MFKSDITGCLKFAPDLGKYDLSLYEITLENFFISIPLVWQLLILIDEIYRDLSIHEPRLVSSRG